MNLSEHTDLISVIIPVYNAEDTIGAALKSVTCQQVGDFEIIIVNDGSTDNSINEIYAFKKAYPESRITIIDKQHEGVSATRNVGLKIASGNYIAFLDADDVWYPEKTTRQLSLFSDDIDLVGCLHKPEEKQAIASKNDKQIKHVSTKEMLFKNFFQTSTVIMKCKVLETTGFFERSISCGEERHYFLRASKTFSCVLLNENLINYGNGKRGFGQQGLSANLIQMEIGELKSLVYAYKTLNMPLFVCCNAITFSLLKFLRRVCIVYVADKLKFFK